MAIPSWAVVDPLALEQVKAVNDILCNLIQSMAEMQTCVSKGRAIMKTGDPLQRV